MLNTARHCEARSTKHKYWDMVRTEMTALKGALKRGLVEGWEKGKAEGEVIGAKKE